MSKTWEGFTVTKEFLQQYLNYIFVFGDNKLQSGMKGAAILRNEPNSYGFTTKKVPCNKDKCFFKAEEYKPVFEIELRLLIIKIEENRNRTFLISKIGSGLANRFGIFEKVILPGIQVLKKYSNVIFLFDPEIDQ